MRFMGQISSLLIGTALFLSSAAWAGEPLTAYTTLKDFLSNSTWCFADKDGPRYHGRIRFKDDGTGLYDVVDAPGPGGIKLTWDTWEHGLDMVINLEFASGMNPLKQWADAAIFNEDEMMWTFYGTDGSISTLNRCR